MQIFTKYIDNGFKSFASTNSQPKKGLLNSIFSYLFSSSKSKIDTSWIEKSKQLHTDDKSQLFLASLLDPNRSYTEDSFKEVKRLIKSLPYSQFEKLKDTRIKAQEIHSKNKSFNPEIIKFLANRESFLQGLYNSSTHTKNIKKTIKNAFKTPRFRRADERFKEAFYSLNKQLLKVKVNYRFAKDNPSNRKIGALLHSFLKVENKLNDLSIKKDYSFKKPTEEEVEEYNNLIKKRGNLEYFSQELKAEFSHEDISNLQYLIDNLPSDKHYPSLSWLKKSLQQLISEISKS